MRLRIAGLLFVALNVACAPNQPTGKTDKTDRANDASSLPKTPRKPSETVRIVAKSFRAMGTVFNCSVAVMNDDNDAVNGAIDAAFAEISRVERLMSVYLEDSYVSKINRAAGEGPVSVPGELVDLIDESKRLSERTEGKFDISFGAAGKLWDFHASSPSLPDPKALKAATKLIDYRSIATDVETGTVMLKKKGMSIGLGGVAKGYGVDRASAVLKEKGFDNFILDGGGDIYIAGTKGGKPWRVGIQNPRYPNLYFADFSMEKTGAVVTSGDYERFFEIDGKRYHHILDPSTGYPARGVVSATVFADSAMKADALATGIAVLGVEKGMKLVESDPLLEAVLVDDKLTPHISSGLKGKIAPRPTEGKL